MTHDPDTDPVLVTELEVQVLERMLHRCAGNPNWAAQAITNLARERLLAAGRQPPVIGGKHGLN